MTLHPNWPTLSRVLEEAYGNPRHGNPEEPMDCLFYLMLTRKTPIQTGQRVFADLKRLAPSWADLLLMPRETIMRALHGSGLEEIRAGHLRQVAQILFDRFGSVTLDPLRTFADEECVQFLTGLPGVGVKTALCVMLYALNRQVFPADAHCIRILGRLGVIPQHLQHRPAQRQLACLVPREFAYSLHVNLVAHEQSICKATRPRCEACVIRSHCSYGNQAILAAEPSPAYK